MTALESYIFLFCDSFFSALILPPRSEMVVKLMTSFAGYNYYLVFFIACSASILGSCINFLIGKYFLFLRKSDFFVKKESEIKNAEEKWNKYIIYLLLFSWISAVANPISLLCGFLRTNIYKFLFFN